MFNPKKSIQQWKDSIYKNLSLDDVYMREAESNLL